MNTIPCIFTENDLIIQQEQVAMKGYANPFSQWNNNPQFFSLNPVKQMNDTRKSENISVMKNFLFESDTLSVAEQKVLLKERLDIISMATYSGNKSIHFIIQVKDPPETIEQYHYVWKLLKDKYFQNADTQCNDCIRLTRTPNSIRTDTNKTQFLLFNKLQPLDIQWRGLYETIQKYKSLSYEYRKTIPITRNENLTYEAECILNGNYPKGERDEIIRMGLPYLFYNGYTLNEILENNIKTRNNPQTIKNYYHKLESDYYDKKVK
jgi:hypothetical protein